MIYATSMLTKRQEYHYEVLKRFYDEKGYPPCLREYAAALGFSTKNGASKAGMMLIKKGYARKAPRGFIPLVVE